MSPAGILETVLYAKNLAATETFYRDVLGLEPFVSEPAGIFSTAAATRCC